MAIPANQIGNDPQSKLLWQISKQLEKQTQVISNSGGGGSFDGQLTQGGADVSNTNPLPVEFAGTITASAIADSTFQDSTGQIFVYRDNGVDVPIAYKIPEWTVYTPIGAVSATSSPLTNYALEADGNLESINGKLPALSGGKVPVTDPTSLPLPTGAATETGVAAIVTALGTPLQAGGNVAVTSSALPTGASTSANQTNGSQRTKITDGTLNASLLEGGSGYVGLLTSVGPALFLSSTANSSTAQLAPGATFTGTIETVFSQPAIQINMVSDQPMIVTINQYIDAAGLKRSGAYAYSIPAGAGFDMCLPMAGNYFNVTVQNNGAATTTTFTLDVTYGTMQAVDTYGAQTVSMTQLAYGTANAVYVGGTSQVQVTPTVTSASAYATGNVVGGLLTFPNIVNSTVKSGVLESISIAVKSLQTTSFKLYIFKGAPSTTFTNKTAPAIVVGDADKLLDVYSFTTPDNGLGNNVTLYYSDAINRSLVLDGSSMYGVLVCLGTPTFTTTTDVIVTASILRD